MTEAALAEAAVFYLSRYASSSGNLRRVLINKVRRSAAYHGDDPAALVPAVEAIVARHAKSGAVNDSAYAESQMRKLRRRGGSARTIVQTLAAKGVPSELVAEAAATLADDAGDREAAIVFARRRRLGPFRRSDRAENRQRDLAALGRAGFDYATAATVIDATDEDALTG
jgi:regulatory protein